MHIMKKKKKKKKKKKNWKIGLNITAWELSAMWQQLNASPYFT